MSGAALVFDIRGLPAVARMGDRLEAFAKEAAGEVLDVVGAVVESQTRRRLADEKKSPEGIPWAPLSPGYEARKKAKSSGGLLEMEGLLINSIAMEVNGRRVRVGSAREYAATHQFGDDREITVPAHTRVVKKVFGKTLAQPLTVNVSAHKLKRNIPARPFLGIGPGDEAEISEALNDYFQALAAKHLNGEVR